MKQWIILLFSLFFSIGNLFGQERIVCDETCEIGADTNSAAWDAWLGELPIAPP